MRRQNDSCKVKISQLTFNLPIFVVPINFFFQEMRNRESMIINLMSNLNLRYKC